MVRVHNLQRQASGDGTWSASAQVVVSFYDQADTRDSRLQLCLTVNCSDLIAGSAPLRTPPSLHFTTAIRCRQRGSPLNVAIKMRSVLNLVVSISLSHAAARLKV